MTEGWHWALIFTIFCLLPIVTMILGFTWPYILIALLSGENPFNIFVTNMSQRKESRQMRLGTHPKSLDVMWKENPELFTQGCKAAGLSPCEQRKFAEFFRSYPTSSYSFLVEEAREWKNGYGPSLQRDCAEEEKAALALSQTKRAKELSLQQAEEILLNENFQDTVWKYQEKFLKSYQAALKRDKKKNPLLKPTKLVKEEDWDPYITNKLPFLDKQQVGIVIPAAWVRETTAVQYGLIAGIEMAVDSEGKIFVPYESDDKGFNGFVFQNLEEFLSHLESEMEEGEYPIYNSLL